MRKLTRLYTVMLRAAFLEALEYRWQSLFWLLAGVFPLVMMAVWLALTNEVGDVQGWGSADFVTYYVLGTLVNQITGSYLSYILSAQIRQGELSVALLKPVHPLHGLLVLQTLGYKIVVTAALIPFVFLVSAATGMIRTSADPVHWIAFFVALVIGFTTGTLLSAILGTLSFWFTNANSISGFINGFEQFLSGNIAPLSLFSGAIQTAALILPFRLQLGFPVEILMGRLSYEQIVQGLVIGLIWMIILWFGFRWMWARGLRQYEGVGA